MSTLREAAQEALFWMQHARLHLTIKERLHPDGLIQYDNAARNLRAALAQPKTELRDQHKAFTHWYFGLRGINEANFNPEYLAWAAWKAALAQPEPEPVVIGPEWTPCVKLPITVHVREQRDGEQHVSTREGITPVKPDDLIMRGVAGEEYPIGRELFAKTYRIGDKLPPDDAEPAAWAVTCDGSAVEARLTETAANLIAQNLREKNRARGFDWRVHPLYLHPPQPCAQRYALTECKALAQPETTAEPVAWLNRYHAAMVTQDHATAAVMGFTTPLYAHPPRDEWRPASEPPEDGRRYRYLKSFCSPMGLDANNNHSWTCRINPSRMRGASVDEALDAAMERDGWRDVTPPTESTIAAKCQRIEGSGKICGLTPPCPDCGSSLIDVADGSL